MKFPFHLLEFNKYYFLGFVTEFAILEDSSDFSKITKNFVIYLRKKYSRLTHKGNLITFEPRNRYFVGLSDTPIYKCSIKHEKINNFVHFKLHINYSIFFILIPIVGAILGFINTLSLIVPIQVFFLGAFPFLIWAIILAGLIVRSMERTIKLSRINPITGEQSDKDVLINNNLENEFDVTTLREIYKEANNAKNNGDIEKATKLYKSILEQYPNSTEAEYAQINIKEMEVHKDGYSQDRRPIKAFNVFKSSMSYGFVGAIIGFINVSYSIYKNPEAFFSVVFMIIAFIVYVPISFIFGAAIGIIVGIIKSQTPQRNL